MPNKFGVLLAKKEGTREISQPTYQLSIVIRTLDWFIKPTQPRYRRPSNTSHPIRRFMLHLSPSHWKAHWSLCSLVIYFVCAPHRQERAVCHTPASSHTITIYCSIPFSWGFFYPLEQAAHEPHRDLCGFLSSFIRIQICLFVYILSIAAFALVEQRACVLHCQR